MWFNFLRIFDDFFVSKAKWKPKTICEENNLAQRYNYFQIILMVVSEIKVNECL